MLHVQISIHTQIQSHRTFRLTNANYIYGFGQQHKLKYKERVHAATYLTQRRPSQLNLVFLAVKRQCSPMQP